MNNATRKTVGKAMADIRAALKTATAEEREAIAASLRDLLAKAEGTPVVAPAQAKRQSAPSAEEVNATARRLAAEGRAWTMGSDKVFIVDVYEALGLAMSIDQFKALIVSYNQHMQLSLSRADLVEAMDPGKVAASETRSLGATFHFVRGE